MQRMRPDAEGAGGVTTVWDNAWKDTPVCVPAQIHVACSKRASKIARVKHCSQARSRVRSKAARNPRSADASTYPSGGHSDGLQPLPAVPLHSQHGQRRAVVAWPISRRQDP